MLYFFSLLLIISPNLWAQSYYDIDYGSGSDGACAFNNQTINGTYNCTTITISGTVTSSSSSALILRATSSVTISGILTVTGGNGNAGVFGASVTGGTGIAGGSAGGSCSSDQAATGDSGSGLGGGGGGFRGFDPGAGVTTIGGGGGAGASYSTSGSAGTKGVDGAVVGGNGGSASSIYGQSDLLDLDTYFVAGSGGGSGGPGDSAGAFFCGGTGGAGGGKIKIEAQGNIQISGQLLSNGGNGGAGNTNSGGGGGGSGGAIVLKSLSQISVSGTVSAVGGSAGSGAGGAPGEGDGGAGGNGRILIKDSDGAVTNTGTITPSASVSTLSLLPNPQFETDIQSFGCGQIQINNQVNSFSWLLGLFLTPPFAFIRRKLKKREKRPRS